MTPAAYAKNVEKWARSGFSFDMVQGARRALEADASDGRRSAPKKTGALAGTIRVSNPSSSRAGKTGLVSISLLAGSRSKGNPVAYASVLLRGQVGWPGKPKTSKHDIIAHGKGAQIASFGRRRSSFTEASGKALKFTAGGQEFFRRKVRHPGSDFSNWNRNWLKVDQRRLERDVDRAIEAGAQREGVA